MIRQRLLVIWANYSLQHFARVFVKGVLALVIVGSAAAAPVVVKTAHHHHNAPAVVKKVAVKTSPKISKPAAKPPAAPAPAVTTPVAAPAPAVTHASAPAPQPIPATEPAPGSGAKSLTPTSSSSPPGGGGGAAAPTGTSLPDATGGYTSTNWAGYVALSGSYTAVTGSWTVPAVTGNGTTDTAEASWIGIGGVTANDLIQTGTLNIVSADGSVDTEAFYELLPDAALVIPSVAVSAGDNMSAIITETTVGSWQITITDNTNGQKFTTSVTYASSHSSAEWIEEDPSYGDGSQVPYATFSSVSFAAGTATRSGTAGTIAANSGQPITMVSNATGQPIAVPSVLTSNGGGFNVTRK